MLTKKQIQDLAKLKQKKYREETSYFVVEGKKSVTDGINSKFMCLQIVATNEFEIDNKDFLKSKIFETVNNSEFQKLSSLTNPQGILGVFSTKGLYIDEVTSNKVLVLENIADPGNMGTIIRTADWFGITEIVVSKNCVEILNPKVIQSSMGSIFRTKFKISEDVAEVLTEMKKNDYKIYVTDLNGKSFNDITYNNKLGIVLSSEAHGPSDAVLNQADDIVTIPKLGNAESLNVAISNAIILSKICL